MVPYRQGKPAAADAFKLSSNENPFEPIAAVREALAGSSINRYPDATATVLRGILADRFGVTAEQIQVGAGSVSVITQLITAAAGHGDEVVYAWRSFEAYPGIVTVAGATSVQVPLTADHRHDLPAMAAAVTDRTRVILVCSPNNPTGTIVTADEFETFMAAVPESVLVLLDEAYIEFVTDPAKVDGPALLSRYPNLVVLRTFSKAYGLAGLRVGYALGAEYIMDAARATAIPLSVTEPAQIAAIVSLEHEDELLERVHRIAVLRDQVWQALIDQGWNVPKPHGNFLWLPTGEQSTWAAEVFTQHGIVVRALLPEGIRVSIGETGSVDKLLKAAADVVRELRTGAAQPALD
ncbi:aminotransferase class I/II-fold pyridoxal phosphate-dependent enzyme [Glaciihabitans arcticus]|uniref:Aminotransferase class I/II-fold pyridoxal phosphate-dependent enzyme n=2 Tax=Glaciihabitans arcticus TaxID=2668039 RepID=A0A4Q9GV28_9MICO|nr:aminotransferase class I/II-fold pyridoxal phosphate-dependent enzyme [Glaciihabitans arcticus]